VLSQRRRALQNRQNQFHSQVADAGRVPLFVARPLVSQFDDAIVLDGRIRRQSVNGHWENGQSPHDKYLVEGI
jgi:hypothetical protein